PSDGRLTLCLSSEIGCNMACSFCFTGKQKLKRRLTAGEIVGQFVQVMDRLDPGERITNIVYMGMGEPLLNYANVLKSIERITAEDGLNMAAKRITVSTAGIAKMIKKLGDDQVKFNLALSLHAANDKKRNEIMPINEQNSLVALAEALKYYFSKTKNPVTYEYIVFNDFNDSIQDAAELAKFCRHVPCKVNIIEYNPIAFAAYQNAGEDKIEAFAEYLRRQGVITNIRRSRGKDIDAACGQLAIKEKAKVEPSNYSSH
ncbi:MAG TPA: 23S rRNA (adenine(2503)-C(2))-methyltransferase RlmN, partial [Mucilaginibacter sp.]|nr:23S rRNA (adenine(2503)-C(2))-methyltransferase RlmN [Mucilaginibacter sp.]